MRKNTVWWLQSFLIIQLACMAVMAVFTIRVNIYLFFGEVVVMLMLIYLQLRMKKKLDHDATRYLQAIASKLSIDRHGILSQFPLPISVIGEKGEIVWYNDSFARQITGRQSLYENIRALVDGFDENLMSMRDGDTANIRVGNRYFDIYADWIEFEQGRRLLMYYWFDQTRLHDLSEEYRLSRPVVSIIVLDNYDAIAENVRYADRANLLGEAENLLQNWAGGVSGIFRRIERDRFLFVFEQRYLGEYMQSRFDILDKVRASTEDTPYPITLSIGVGQGGKTLYDNLELARQGVDMALGRGGDQAVIKNREGFEFFGGKAKPVEKRTKVRTRIMATALRKLIEQQENILIMGHRYADLDCLGSAVGMASACMQMDKPVHIVIDRRANAATDMLAKFLKNPKYEDIFVDKSVALDMIEAHTLLIVVDTHRGAYLEAPEVYKNCKNVVVIDHHRKMADFIDNAIIFYHEHYASSACEMVTELLQYMQTEDITLDEAEALFAGISLDTKNYTLRTGVRTFEAAAYLRQKGADPVAVKKYFRVSFEEYRYMLDIIARSKIYNDHIAVSIWNSYRTGTAKTLAARAADELLNISGVDASFVLFADEEQVNISARSMGEMNVQVVLEALGGGGHHTMAGAQIRGKSVGDVEEQLLGVIESYLKNQ